MNKRLPWWVTCSAILALALLYLPMLAVVVFSLNDGRYGFAWRGFTLKWYAQLLHNRAILDAATNTLILAGVSTAIATPLGTLLGVGLVRFPWTGRTRRAMEFLLYLPVVTPDIVFAAAMVVAFSFLRVFSDWFEPGLATMILAHVTFQIAFVALVIQSRLATLGRTLEEAARDLYADTHQLMRRVTLPLLLPGIVAGAMLAFTLSLDDFVISFFTAGPESTTLPILIYAAVRRGITPELHALSTLVFLLTVVVALLLERLSRIAYTEPKV